jgi:hypothetical protein
MLRTEALTKLSIGGNRKIIVTYPEALFEKVVFPKHSAVISSASKPMTPSIRTA